ncbi:sensor histidine kinase [Lyngbya confervoides]|uniref:histidine kinase n=1 Tax=Lyngbya confervoides BDU141951 TaxID=1574623 RepID=A0ABD4SZV9_9CYAN|nr:ATP-binding protein [Lyngbya confervoides]MCM1981690.1 ATP-binding protein [Lyngbya confervoides BDU141951]
MLALSASIAFFGPIWAFLGAVGNPFIPHGHCYLWNPSLIWLHVLSDSAIAIAYYSIPLTLVYLVNKREDLPFNWIFLLFGGFIVSCGTTHIFEVWTLWYPDYWVSGTMKLLTALISIVTAVVLVMIIPQVLNIPSTAQLERANQSLMAEVHQRKQVEAEVRQLNATLEERVVERTQELTQARLEAERSGQQLRAILANTPALVYLKDLAGRIILANPECANQFNLSPEEMEGLTDFDYLPPNMADRLRKNDRQVLAQRSAIEFEETIVSKEQLKIFLSVKFPLFDSKDQPYAIGGISTDITARKQAEKDLAERAAELTALNQTLQQTTRELEYQNRELDQFSYIVSHDLKAPLRAIANLSTWIEEDLAAVMTTETRQQMGLLRDRVTRMNQMIQGLLDYSRAGRVEGPREPVEVEKLLEEIIDLLGSEDSVQIALQRPMPVLTTQRILLSQVFMNLLSNAIKHNHQDQGKIAVSAQAVEGGYEFTVTDNGPGIDPEDQERIFNIFETLGPSQNVYNTGIGLALVKKVVKRQGGWIKVTSAPGSGASFCFFWPTASC